MQVSAVGAKTQGTSQGFGIDTGDFLRLLIAEIQHQNPLEPLKEAEFISQAAQFCELDELRRGCSLLERIADDKCELFQAAPMIGMKAQARIGDGLVEGEITGVAAGKSGTLVIVSGVLVPIEDMLAVWKESE